MFNYYNEFMHAFKDELHLANAVNNRSAWARGVGEYALELLEDIAERMEYDRTANNSDSDYIPTPDKIREYALNGAETWDNYSYGGCSLIYDGDIAERLCTPSELKRTRNGERQPNSAETWLDIQALALNHANNRVMRAYHKARKRA